MDWPTLIPFAAGVFVGVMFWRAVMGVREAVPDTAEVVGESVCPADPDRKRDDCPLKVVDGARLKLVRPTDGGA